MKDKPVGRLTKEEQIIKNRIEARAKSLEGRRKGQSKGIDLPEGWYMKAGKAHRFDSYLDNIRKSKHKLKSSSQKDKWRADYGDKY